LYVVFILILYHLLIPHWLYTYN